MTVQCFNIKKKLRDNPLGFANINDFKLQKSGNVSPQVILDNPHITLYCLDFQSKNGIFVETGGNVNLSQAPFLYNAQYDNAIRVYAVPIPLMVRMASAIPLEPQKLVFIHSVGRAGSTLASQICMRADGVKNLSEPEVLTWLVAARLNNPGVESQLSIVFDACIRFLCKDAAETAHVIKGRSFVIELGDWVYQHYPQSKNIFLYRDAVSWLKSGLQAYIFELPEVDMKVQEENLIKNLSPVVPLISDYCRKRHLKTSETISLIWLSGMERYMKLHEAGFEMLAIRYKSWRDAPGETARAMLDYCNLSIDDNALEEVLNRDSQAGTFLSREVLGKKKERELTEEDIECLNQLLKEHPQIQSADYEVPNTLRLRTEG